MSTAQVTSVLALLALGAAALTIGITVVAILAGRSGEWSQRLERFRQHDGSTAILAGAIIAGVAMAGSLYLSEVANFVPCRMCWYQRIAAYPLVPILLLAWWRRDHGIRPYVWLLCGLGSVISIYHVLLERFPSLESSACELDNPCSAKPVEKFGFVTIPTMALITFATVAALLWVAGPGRRASSEPSENTGRPATADTPQEA